MLGVIFGGKMSEVRLGWVAHLKKICVYCLVRSCVRWVGLTRGRGRLKDLEK